MASNEPLAAGETHDFTLWQSRLERWRRIAQLLGRALTATGRLRIECVQASASELSLLRPGERLWAYPGVPRVARLRWLVAAGEVAAAAAEAGTIARLMSLYGDGAARVEHDGSRPKTRHLTAAVVARDARQRLRPLARALARLGRPGEEPAYALVPLASVEEALMAARYNPYVEVLLLGDGAALWAVPPTRLLGEGERRLLAAAATGPTPPIAWLADWLGRARPDLRVAPLAAGAEALHRLLAA